ncbi:discoidin domain-containing protein [Microbacterium trichothecenolyticum]|uniref:Discoidin domain-containing protein n=1 Tax=Microbacterium ureisolvens TaxID=2781186 RepID=A0ABS7I3X1_9MICO|nr:MULTISPECIES: discoidin domain-containing protein [Microbacterium]MBW9111955.1 discoidin domain-containing protein [Microbacterium ureisolvens]MBW9122376.1 discoidin domain-containing protein [Microbacterium trichothecenolyticum]
MKFSHRIAAILAASGVIAAGFVVAVPQVGTASTGTGGKVSVTYSSYNVDEGSYRLSSQADKTLSALTNDTTTTVLVDPSIRYQTYEGFGSTLEDTTIYHLTRLSPTHREEALQAIFSEANGINFNLMRTTIGCADFCRTAKTTGFWTYDDNGGVADPTLANFSIQRDITDGKISVMQDILRINPETRFFASMWSPPAWMKTSNSIIAPDNKNCAELPANAHTVHHGAATGSSVDYYPVLAQYYVKYIQAYQAQGIPIAVVSLQNEPDIARTYPTNCFTPAQEADFAAVLRTAFNTAGLTTKVWGLDDNQHSAFPVGDDLLADPADRGNIDGLGFHNYEGQKMWAPEAFTALYPDKTTHLTEITQGANKLIEYFRSGVSSYNGWGMMFQFSTVNGTLYNAGPGWWQDIPVNMSDPDADTPPMIMPKASDYTDFDLHMYYYVFGQFSKFLHQGAQRIDSPDRMGDIYNVAFRNPDGTLVVVVVNRADTRYITTQESTTDKTVRIATPDGQFSDTIPGDTIATYVITPTTGDPVSRSGWTATASHTAGAFTATQAIDGQSTTRWSSGANQTAGQSLTVDLGASRTFDQVSLNQMELSGDFPAGYEVRVSTNGSTWSSPVATGAGTPSITNIAFSPQTARYVRVSLTASASRWWSVGELSVWNSASGLLPRDGATATGSSTASGTAASNALDGTMQTAWTTATSQTSGQTFTVDLGSSRSFNTLELDSGASSGDYPRVYSVQTSTNGTTWSSPVAKGNGQSRETFIATGAQTARYVRVTLTANWSANPWTIREFRVLNAPATTTDRGGWTTSASHTWAGTAAGDVLDGSATTRWSTGVAQADGQWFQIDMHQNRWVNGIRLDSAAFTGDYGRATRIEASLDATTWRTVADIEGLTQTSVVRWPVTQARYLRIVETLPASANYWSLAEVDVLRPDSAPATLTPLARTGWTASTVPTGSGAPSLGIDGLLNTRWASGAALTGTEQYQVDMGSTRTFRGVQVVAGGTLSAGTDFAKTYEVWVSSGGAWTKVAEGAGYGPVITAKFASTTARYVLFKQTGTSTNTWWSVGEFNVLN